MIQTLLTGILLRRLCANTRRSSAFIEAEQDRRLRRIVDYAWQHVSFYRRYWSDAGFDPRRFRGLADLERIPIVTRGMLDATARADELLAAGVDRNQCTWIDTTGSSGRRLRIYKRAPEERVRRAVGLRIWKELGFSWFDATVDFQRDAGPGHPLQRFGIAPKTFILCNVPPEERLKRFLASDAAIIVGTATALRRIARQVERAGARVRRPRIVFCAGEHADRFTRQLVQRVFGAEPVGIFGQSEVGYIAWQCERRNGFHMNADTHLVEIRRNGRPAQGGELGRTIVTDLYGRTMPFIRYDAGDLATAESKPCPCGRSLPVLRSIEGRASGVLLAADGSPVTGPAIVEAMCAHVALEDVQVVQDSKGNVRLLVAEEALHQSATATAASAVGSLLGRPVAIVPASRWTSPQDWKTMNTISHLSAASQAVVA